MKWPGPNGTLALASVFFFLSPCAAGYNVQANAISGAFDGVKRLAVAPASCPSNFDCVWLENKLAEELKRRGDFGIVSAAAVKQTMLELSVDKLNDETRKALAERLGVEAFVIGVVGHSGKKSEGMTGFVSGGVFYLGEDSVDEGSAELVVLRASDAKIVVKGTGFGSSEFRTSKGIVLKVFREIIQRTFPPSH